MDLNKDELQVMLYALSMYQKHMMDQEKELQEIEEKRKARHPKPVDSCYCCIDIGPQKKAPPPRRDVGFIEGLRQKLKKEQLMVPLEEHKLPAFSKYSDEYGRVMEAFPE